jgi:cytochrome c oxidase subunit 2
VPAFRLKLDAVPGQTGHVRFTPNRPGSYEVVCAELCGTGHSTMRVAAVVMSPQKFEQFVQSKLKPAGSTTTAGGGGGSTATAAQGKAIFAGEGGCGGCHKLTDAGTTGGVGPPLNGVAGKGAAYIKQSIENPNADIAPGFPKGIMPQDFKTRLGPEKVDALVKYLLEAGK